MIRQIRHRPRVDVLTRETRPTSARWGRLIYLTLLATFALVVANYLFGSALFLKAPGLLLQAQYSIAPPYEARVVRINVKPGEAVDSNMPLVEVESPTLARAIADLSLRQAELKTKVEQVRSKLVFADTMIPIAREPVNNTQRSIDSLDRLETRQLASLKRREDVNSASYTARSQLADLETQKRSLARELEASSTASVEADAMYQQFKQLYNNGTLFAPSSGIVGARVAAEGDVLVPGNRVLTIHSGPPYVLAYLPASYVFPVQPNQRVTVSGGNRTVIGSVRDVLAVADALPAEFQSGLKPRDRSQLVRIALPDNSGFAAQQQVLVSSCLTDNCDPWGSISAGAKTLLRSGETLVSRFTSQIAEWRDAALKARREPIF